MKTDRTLHSIDITLEDIEHIINKQNSKKAHGFDGISIAFVKSCSLELAFALKLIFTKCIEKGIFPDKWKHANVQPVHKNNSRQVLSNYWPIYLLPIFGKIF